MGSAWSFGNETPRDNMAGSAPGADDASASQSAPAPQASQESSQSNPPRQSAAERALSAQPSEEVNEEELYELFVTMAAEGNPHLPPATSEAMKKARQALSAESRGLPMGFSGGFPIYGSPSPGFMAKREAAGIPREGEWVAFCRWAAANRDTAAAASSPEGAPTQPASTGS